MFRFNKIKRGRKNKFNCMIIFLCTFLSHLYSFFCSISFNNSSSKLHYTSHILGRKFALTLTAYKYLDIGINVGSVSFVELFIGDNQGNRLILSRATWKIFIERRVDIEHSAVNCNFISINWRSRT